MSLLGGSHATPRQGTEAIRAPERLTCGECMGMLHFPSLSRNSSCREKAAGLLPALPARVVPPCPGCDGAIPLLLPCLHMESGALELLEPVPFKQSTPERCSRQVLVRGMQVLAGLPGRAQVVCVLEHCSTSLPGKPL